MSVIIASHDELEVAHRRDALDWLHSTDDVFRRSTSPTRPLKHLVSYFVLVDSVTGRVLLGDHRRSGLWLPSGGHVEPGEHPVATVQRECREELGVPARFHPRIGDRPVFVTVTETVGPLKPHTDVSLWHVLDAETPDAVTPDPREYRSVRWWGPDEIRAGDPESFDPHLVRMLDKLDGILTEPGHRPERPTRRSDHDDA